MSLPGQDRPFTDEEAAGAWNAGAAAWLTFVRSGADYYRLHVHGPALLAACGAVSGLRALDLGCGEGYFARELARAGARVTAAELAEHMLAPARAEEDREPLGIVYHHMSAADIAERFAPGSFDLVASCMAIQDMADPGAVLRAATDVLATDGRLVFSVPHPCSDTVLRRWERAPDGRKIALCIDGYFDAGPAVCDWNMPRLAYAWRTPHWRKTIEQWSTLIADAGFLIRRLHEPHPDAAAVAATPQLEDCARLPYFLIFDLLRAATQR